MDFRCDLCGEYVDSDDRILEEDGDVICKECETDSE